MKRTIIQSLVFSLILIVIYYGIQIARGYIMTINYVPVDYLEHKTSFGLINPYWILTELIGLMVIGIIIFVGVKVLVLRIKRK